MSRLLLVTDSNFFNNIGDYKGPKIKNLEVKSCQSRKAAIEQISAIYEGLVVFSCLDMIAADVSRTTLNNAGEENYHGYFLGRTQYKGTHRVLATSNEPNMIYKVQKMSRSLMIYSCFNFKIKNTLRN